MSDEGYCTVVSMGRETGTNEGRGQAEHARTHDRGGTLEKESAVREHGSGMDLAPTPSRSTTTQRRRENIAHPRRDRARRASLETQRSS